MARTSNLTDFLTDVSSAIKQKTGDSAPIPASEFDTEILSIETAGNYQSKTLNITQNGNYNLLPDQEFDAISNVNISVSVSPVLQNKTITENGSYTADSGYDGLDTVIVNVPSGIMTQEEYDLALATAYDILQRDIPMYTELEYIESTGTQYIDTLIKANNYLKINLDFMTLGSTDYHGIIGVRDKVSLYYLNSIGTNYYQFEYGWNSPYVIKTSTSFAKSNIKTKLLIDKNSISISNANGTYNNSVSNTNFSSTGNIYLFAFNDNGTAARIGNTRIYGCTISNLTDTLLVLVPAIDKDGTICMYDKISNKFFYNKGTGDFMAGPIKNGGEN